MLRNSLFSGVRNPLYEGFDLTHSRRIGNFDVSGGLNLFTDEGYRQQGYNKRFHINGNLTYYQPDMGMKLMNYGFNVDFLSNKYGDFFIWRSPARPTAPLPLLIWDVSPTTSALTLSSTSPILKEVLHTK